MSEVGLTVTLSVMIIAFTNQKGGTAKSTTAVHFAHWVVNTKRKKRVAVVDADEQQSSATWLRAMDTKVSVFSLLTTNDILDQVLTISESNDVVVIDAPASAQEVARAVLLVSDLAIVPVHPAAIDIHSSAETIRLISQAQKVRGELPKAAAFLSRAIRGTKLKHEAIAFLENTPNLIALKSVIHQRVVVADTFGQDATVWHLPRAHASQNEYKSLFTEIWRLVK